MQEAEIQAAIHGARWYHAFEVLPGFMTPGISAFDPKATLDYLGVPPDLSGKRVLDVGTWDGPLAFEMEARGAEVYALDVQDPDCTAFNTARKLRGSKVQYTQGSVYDIQKIYSFKFDLITYFGVYYHLKHPILSFEALHEGLADGGILCFEGEVLVNYSENLLGQRSNLDNRALAESDVPLCLCYPGLYKGVSNWFVPNLACIRSWLLATGFDMASYSVYAGGEETQYPAQRIMARAHKAGDMGVLEETNIFKKKLEMPAEWYRQFEGLHARRASLADVLAQKPLLPPRPEDVKPEPRPSLLQRIWRRLGRG